jgi:hypothetical protein
LFKIVKTIDPVHFDYYRNSLMPVPEEMTNNNFFKNAEESDRDF